MTNEKLKEALDSSIKQDQTSTDKPADVELTDEDLDDVAGGLMDCGVMCGTYR